MSLFFMLHFKPVTIFISLHQPLLGINHAVGTPRADIERIEGIGAVGAVFEKIFF